ncbi:hypothetical protein, partial [Massilia niabensis]
ADDSAATSVKVGYRQASYKEKPRRVISAGFFAFGFWCVITGLLLALLAERALKNAAAPGGAPTTRRGRAERERHKRTQARCGSSSRVPG